MADSRPTTTEPDSAATVVGRQLARERVRAMESLAATIAHEIRSSVLALTSAAQLLRYALPPDPIAEKSLGRILQESERLSALHEALSEYATEIPPRLTRREPDALWTRVLDDLRGALEASSMTASYDATDPTATCQIDDEQLRRAFERIVHHAIARGHPGARMTIATSATAQAWECHVSVGDEARGPRLAPTDFERPTFLIALAHRTVVAHRGEFVENTSDRNATQVTVRLPLSSSNE